MERHKDAIINLAIESWHFAKNYERAITRLNTNRTQRYTRQLEQFIQKAEESLEEVGLRIVNVEGTPYDPGMAATPLNIEDFEPEDQLVVDKMLEPIIMEGTILAKTRNGYFKESGIMDNYIGIDLGTTNSAICTYNKETLQTRVWKSPEINGRNPVCDLY